MNRDDLISGIRKVWEFARVLDLGEVFANPAPLEPSGEFAANAIDPDCSYETLYLSGLQNGDYNIQLADFSFFQFGISKGKIMFVLLITQIHFWALRRLPLQR